MSEIDAIIAVLAQAPAQRAALATLVAVEGSSYRRPGARLLLLPDGKRVGSISGGCLEDDIVLRAREVLATENPQSAVYDTTQENDLVWGVGLGCRGVVRVFIEAIPVNRPGWLAALAQARAENREIALAVVHAEGSPGRGTRLLDDAPETRASGVFVETVRARPALIVFGAGDDAQPVVRLARETGWRVTVVDSRSAYATAARFPAADTVLVARADDEAVVAMLTPDAYVVVMTHRFAEDTQLLATLLPRPLTYVGVLGPRKRTDRILAHLREKRVAFPTDAAARLFAPVGLDLGGTTPETIALAIVAELQSVRSGRTPLHLRDRPAPIHDRSL